VSSLTQTGKIFAFTFISIPNCRIDNVFELLVLQKSGSFSGYSYCDLVVVDFEPSLVYLPAGFLSVYFVAFQDHVLIL
jgi:hypothetical protein